MSFKGKVAVVTGGAQGFGRSICKLLLKYGMKVCICDINIAEIHKFIEDLRPDERENVIFKKCDVSSYNDFEATFDKTMKEFNKINLLVNNAAVFDEKEWERMVAINFIGVINGIKLGMKYMGTNELGSGGCIINISSNAGLEPFPLGPVYSGCKHGVIGLTKSFSHEYHFKKTGVSVNAICPGPLETPLFHLCPEYSVDKEAMKKFIACITPLDCDIMAEAVIKILSDGKNGGILQRSEDQFVYVE